MWQKIGIVLVSLFIFVTPAHAIDGFIRITNPNGGTFTEGDTVNITWESSSNIDKVNIGYKSCDSCLDWVVFTTPNTGSYSWKVDVGNTTKTQFYLQITGYETGKGSITSNSGTFTVNQNPPISSGSTTTGTTTTTTSTPPPSGAVTRPLSSPSPTVYRLIATPTPTPKPIYLSVTTVFLYQEFYFDGSRTTDLKTIDDPKNVENFTLDTKEGFTFIFQDKLDLTNQKTLLALQNTKDYWEYEEWFIWIEWEWWFKYEVTETINVEYKNDALTGYAPTVVKEEKPIPKTYASKTSNTRNEPKVLGAKAGKVELALNDGTAVKIKPKVELETPTSPTHRSSLMLKGQTSHSNLNWSLNFNGIKTSVNPTLDSDSGIFEFQIDNLIEGANSIILSYAEPNGETVTLEPITVIYKPNFWQMLMDSKTVKSVMYINLGAILFIAGLLSAKIIKIDGKSKKRS